MSTDSNVLTGVIRSGLMNLQELCGSTAAAKGFHEDRPDFTPAQADSPTGRATSSC